MSAKKNKADLNGFIYSTDPNFQFQKEDAANLTTAPPAQQKLIIRLDTRHRGGKAVTLVTGFSGTETDLEELGKKLKNFCGTGGAVKDGNAMVQGDQRDKIMQWLLKNDYRQTKKR